MKLIHAFLLLTLLVLVLSAASVPVYAQCVGMGCDGPIRELYLICCNEPVYNAGEEGVGTDHTTDCRDYVRNRASAETRRSICNQVNSKSIVCPDAVGACNSPNGKYCGDNIPDKGFVYTSNRVAVHEEPFANSPTLGMTNGVRLVYRKTTKTADGQTWYYVHPPGLPDWPHVEIPVMGWISGSDISCIRDPHPLKEDPTDPGIMLRPGTAVVSAARG